MAWVAQDGARVVMSGVWVVIGGGPASTSVGPPLPLAEGGAVYYPDVFELTVPEVVNTLAILEAVDTLLIPDAVNTLEVTDPADDLDLYP